MRRSVCYVNPSIVRAGQISTWRFVYSPANFLPEKTKLRFDLDVQGKVTEWEVPSPDLSQERNVIYLETHQGDVLTAKPIYIKGNPCPQFEFTLPYEVDAGDSLTVVLGAPPQEMRVDEAGNGAQLFTQRRKPFYLYVETSDGAGETEVFSMDIRGNTLKKIQIFTPSYVVKNRRFDVTVRFEDEFGNLTNFSPEDTRIELSYEHLRENLNWQLFIPETGLVILPNLYFNEIGIYRIQLKNLLTKEIFVSSPVRCFAEAAPSLIWGLLHGESERVDSEGSIESCLRYFRDDCALQFFSTSSFEVQEGISADIWKLIHQTVSDFNEEDRFIVFSGLQFVGEPKSEGIRHLINLKEGKSSWKHKESRSSLSKIYKGVSSRDLLSIPCFTASRRFGYDFDQFNPDFERVVEIYNAWGCSERTREQGNPFPITGDVDQENAAGTLLRALQRNIRFGFVAGGFDDRGIYDSFFDGNQKQYSPGLTAVLCEKYTKESFIDALYQRRCYATSGPRIIVSFHITGLPMGSELSAASKPGLIVNRHLSGYVAGTAKLKTVEIIRNGEVLKTFSPSGLDLEYEFDDMEPLSSVVLDDPMDRSPFVFYYLRVTQEDQAVAWSSPIWVDLY